MHKLTQRIIKYTKAKYTLDYCKWHIGLTDNPRQLKKIFKIKIILFVPILNLGLVKIKPKQEKY
ncbi:MAG: hypothetical protein II972_03510 [Elusimicrobiaceae bacterium]|nr:hypothetical protein [Elusimicrobiaceae bacterium]MBQ6224533.1 hypothetical protein [Campylobacter sp.]